MTGAQLQAAAAIIGTLVVLVSFVVSMARAARRQAEREVEIKDAIHKAGVVEGKASRDDEVALLRSQLDDRSRRAESAQRRADAFEARYNDLRDRGGG